MLTIQFAQGPLDITRLGEVGDDKMFAVDEARGVVGEGADLRCRLGLDHDLHQASALFGEIPRRRDLVLEDGARVRVEIT